jgi:sugar lactone lactonase YvrE
MNVKQMVERRVGGLPAKAAAVAAVVAVFVACGAVAPCAGAAIYWTNNIGNTIGRADLDGGAVNQSFITGATGPADVAVDSAHLYWANVNGGGGTTISRANLDGSGVTASFIAGASGPYGVAVDGAHLYWSNDGGGTIGRANLDGTGANQSFISSGVSPDGVAVDGAHIYWIINSTGAIGRANLDGSNVNLSFITGGSAPDGIAVDGAHLYWANSGTSRIGRANLDGTGVNQNFITTATGPGGVGVDGTHVYWSNSGLLGTIGRANLDGSGANQSFITGASNPVGLALDNPPGLSPGGLGFGSAGSPVPQGTVSAPQSVTITNIGAMPMVISGFGVGGANPDDFFTSNDTCHAPVPSNGTCTVQMRFAPQAAGSRSATLTAQSNDAPSSPLPLSGTAGPLPQGPAGGQGPPGRDANVTCKVKKKGTKAKVTCKVQLVAARDARLRWRLTRSHHTYARGVAVARNGKATVNLHGLGDLPKGRYALRIAGRDQDTAIVIG